jgi:hypothetical protein
VLENVPLDWRSEAVDATVQGFLPPRGFRLKTSMMGGQQYWPEVWVLAAAWREQLGEGDAGVGRGGRGRVGRVGGEGVAWAKVVTAY